MAKVRYVLSYEPHQFDDKRRAQGIAAWCLFRVLEDENGIVFDRKAVAVFNLDSDTELFMQAIFAGDKIEIPPEWVEVLTQRRNRSKS